MRVRLPGLVPAIVVGIDAARAARAGIGAEQVDAVEALAAG